MFSSFLALDLSFIFHVYVIVLIFIIGLICIMLFPLHLINKATLIEWFIFKKWESSE